MKVFKWTIIGEYMAPAKKAAEDLVKALKDKSVIAASMFESFLNIVLKKANNLQEETDEIRKDHVAARQSYG